MVLKALKKMKVGKAAGPSGIVVERLKASPNLCCKVIAELANAIVREEKMPTEWKESIILSLYKGKGDALNRGNYRGLKLTEQVLKVVERVVEELLRDFVNIDDMQFGFCPGRGTTCYIHRETTARKVSGQEQIPVSGICRSGKGL